MDDESNSRELGWIVFCAAAWVGIAWAVSHMAQIDPTAKLLVLIGVAVAFLEAGHVRERKRHSPSEPLSNNDTLPLPKTNHDVQRAA
jgi:hypothetical protein